MATDKMNALCVLKMLQEYSDEDHIMTAKDIQEKLKAVYGISPDRRTLLLVASWAVSV